MLTNAQTTVGIIPARYASTRFPGKSLALIGGKVMIQRVYEQAIRAKSLSEVVIAADDERIAQAAEAFGARVIMTSKSCQSGTDRCAEAAQRFPQATHFVNIQGDEPFILPEQIDLLTGALTRIEAPLAIATLCKRITDLRQALNPNVVKVTRNMRGEALYFSRSPIPHWREAPNATQVESGLYFKHIGLYGYSSLALAHIASLAPSPLEQAESLEQLRWLENGLCIAVAETPWETLGVDTPDDLKAAELWLRDWGGTGA